jgi:hypothetical protein
VKVPPELFAEWRNDAAGTQWMDSRTIAAKLVDRAAQWGYDLREPELQQAADQELEAICETIARRGWPKLAADLRTVRRPKPPSLAEQGIEELESLKGDANAMGMGFGAPAIRAALTRLAELEANQ